jgi:hypothetical protein
MSSENFSSALCGFIFAYFAFKRRMFGLNFLVFMHKNNLKFTIQNSKSFYKTINI